MQYNTIALEVSARVSATNASLSLYWQHGATLTYLWIYFILQQDPNGIRIAQWLQQTTVNKILQLSHKLSSEAAEGSYQIRVEADGEQARHWFKVEKYGGSMASFSLRGGNNYARVFDPQFCPNLKSR